MGELAPEINATLTASAAVLVPGDVLSVRFMRLPDWNQDGVLVGPRGMASFTPMDGLYVAGMTIEQLDAKLTEEYTKILAKPELTVRITDATPRNVFIMGEVADAGLFEIPAGRLSLVQAIAMADGFLRDSARLDNTLLVRWDPAGQRVLTWRIDASVEYWEAEQPILLQAHDVVYVPAKPVVHVNDWVDRYLRRNILFFLPIFYYQ